MPLPPPSPPSPKSPRSPLSPLSHSAHSSHESHPSHPHPPPPPFIAILSDTHAHLPAARRAFAALAPYPISLFVHCGDIGENVLSLLSDECLARDATAILALGNCDPFYPPNPAPRVTASPAPRFPIPLGDGTALSCAAVHGHDPRELAALLTSGLYDIVFTGHTHVPEFRRIPPTPPSTRPVLLINPGSPARPRTYPPRPTLALLSLTTHPPTPRLLPL